MLQNVWNLLKQQTLHILIDNESKMKHLWEQNHSYYCNEGNYFTSESVESAYDSWDDFFEENGDSDFDMNLLFRWDWEETDEETGEPTFRGDTSERNGTLKLFWIGQRKGLYRYSLVKVCRDDEPKVISFLKERFNHLVNLWSPLK